MQLLPIDLCCIVVDYRQYKLLRSYTRHPVGFAKKHCRSSNCDNRFNYTKNPHRAVSAKFLTVTTRAGGSYSFPSRVKWSNACKEIAYIGFLQATRRPFIIVFSGKCSEQISCYNAGQRRIAHTTSSILERTHVSARQGWMCRNHVWHHDSTTFLSPICRVPT